MMRPRQWPPTATTTTTNTTTTTDNVSASTIRHCLATAPIDTITTTTSWTSPSCSCACATPRRRRTAAVATPQQPPPPPEAIVSPPPLQPHPAHPTRWPRRRPSAIRLMLMIPLVWLSIGTPIAHAASATHSSPATNGSSSSGSSPSLSPISLPRTSGPSEAEHSSAPLLSAPPTTPLSFAAAPPRRKPTLLNRQKETANVTTTTSTTTTTASPESTAKSSTAAASAGPADHHLTGVHLPGDIILGGLFPVHGKGERTACGANVYNRGVQRLEAMLFAVDRVNADPKLLANITIGVHILDTCSRDTYALNQSLQFVRSSLNNQDPHGGGGGGGGLSGGSGVLAVSAAAFECADRSTPRLRANANGTRSSGPVFGVIGGSYSSVSLQVANLLRLFHIPQISPASTAKALSDKSRFDLFARTVPPDNFQSAALVDIVKRLNWTYVSTIYSEGSYGEYGIEQFHKDASERNVCIALSEKVPSAADEMFYAGIIRKLLRKPTAKGVILFTRAEDAQRILQAAKRANLSQPFHWLASDGWGKQLQLVEGLEDIAEGAITVELQSDHIAEFDEYMQRLTPATNARNPWFDEFWEDFFGCKLARNFPVVFGPDENDAVCNESARLSARNGYVQESKVQFVIDAVYAFAHALHQLQQNLCGHLGAGMCAEMANYDGKEFYNNYLLNVSFVDLAGSEVKFDRQGDGLARYDILNFQRNRQGSGYNYQAVGKWFNNSDGLQLNPDDLVWNGNAQLPTSACSAPCSVGTIRKQQGDTCCWICDPCDEKEYVHDEHTCRACPAGHWPYPDKSGCYALPVEYIRWHSWVAAVPLLVASVGIVTTLSVIVLFVRHNDTPLVRASGRELSYMLLGGCLLCFTNTFALLAPPTWWSCVAQRIGIGVGFSMVYGALLTKTNRISRIFDSAARSARRPRYISPRSQVSFVLTMVGIQFLITFVWMIIEPPGTRCYYPGRKRVILRCDVQNKSFLFSQSYNMLLIFLSTLFAVKTRKIPENFNESKFIGFTMYTTCIIWLAFVPIYFSTEHSYEIQVMTLCLAISLSAWVALVCLYSPKVYILLFHPDKNVRKLTMNSAAYRAPPPPANTANAAATASASATPLSFAHAQATPSGGRPTSATGTESFGMVPMSGSGGSGSGGGILAGSSCASCGSISAAGIAALSDGPANGAGGNGGGVASGNGAVQAQVCTVQTMAHVCAEPAALQRAVDFDVEDHYSRLFGFEDPLYRLQHLQHGQLTGTIASLRPFATTTTTSPPAIDPQQPGPVYDGYGAAIFATSPPPLPLDRTATFDGFGAAIVTSSTSASCSSSSHNSESPNTRPASPGLAHRDDSA